MLTTGEFYQDPGGDFYVRRNPDKAKQRALAQLREMGYEVTLTRPAAS
jgi:transposase